MQLNSPLLMTAVLVAATANSAGQISANIRLGDDPPQLPANRRAQADTHIARSFTNPNLLVATFQEGRYEDGAAFSCGYSVSTNGGLTWSRALIPKLTTLDGGPGTRAFNPMAAIDRQGEIVLITEITAADGFSAMISRSSGGQWETLTTRRILTQNGLVSPWLAVNTFATSHPDRMVLLFNHPNNRSYARYTEDEGVTWTTAQPAAADQGLYCQSVYLPDGSVAVVYTHYPVPGELDDPEVPAEFQCVVSQDGGATFGSPTVAVPSLRPMYVDPIARTSWDIASACADRQAGVIYVTYQALTGPAADRPGIMFTRSIDKGTTWSTPVAVNDTPADQGVFTPAIAVSPDGQHVTVCFYDKRNQTIDSAGNLVDLYLAESFDGGETWEPNLRLSEVSSDLRLAPLTGSGRMLAQYQGVVPALNSNTPGVAVWIDTRTGNPDPYAVRIGRTQGSTFDAWRTLRFSPVDLANLALSGEGADPEGDGLPNLAEYAFATEPTHADGSPLKINQSAPGPGQPITLAYERPAMLSDIQFTWESSPNLVDWTPASPTQEQTGTGRDPSMERVEAAFAAAEQMTFFRLGVARLPLTP